MNIYEEIVEARRRGEVCAVATIIRRRGSAPRKDHAKMLVLRDGRFFGSIGGGCMEAEVWQAAMKSIKDGDSRILNFDLSGKDAAEGTLICGGKLDVFVEPIMPDPKLILFGGGHVSKAIVTVSKLLGFQTTVVDDREAYSNKERFPEADQTIAGKFESVCPSLNIDESCYLIIATRGHEHDQVVTEWAVHTAARYIGLIGSKRKIGLIREHLLDVGIAKEKLANLYAPIGLDIGSETPEEIAVAVAAELVTVLKGRGAPRCNWSK